MNGRKAKQLRRHAKYEKSVVPEVVGDFNITINSGNAVRVVNVKKTQPKELTKEQEEARRSKETPAPTVGCLG